MQAPVPLAGSISIAYVQGLVDHLERRGVAPQRLLAGVQLEPSILDQREARIAASVYVDLLELGLALSGDADLGLHLGEAVRPGHFGVLGYLLMSCATLGDALHRQARYAELVGSLGRVELADEPPRAGHEPLVRHSWEPLLPRQQRQLAEETLACWLRFGHWISGLEQAPLEVRFRHPAPADTTEHRRIFRCPVLFGQADNALVFPRRLLALPLGQADSQIQRTLDAYAGRLLESIRRGEGVLERARQCLAERLPEQAVDLEALAGELALSPRTLQRRLRDSGLSFSRLVDETRQQLVLHHLRDPALELADVASLVGFSETGSLARAFRRWTGQSLGQYRRTLQPLADS
ncbi:MULTISPECIES: AraC family transcriptional regulator [Pseudomonas]|uniref:AraC family transcriptional regulator n=1 Tax=Pseudomonas citronellolis TaxID=53408 RepID=A0AAW6NZW5_9PSED|nr:MULTISPECIES: AraC family transcriptional regulator [Pseudomonas]AMO79370.1 HTH-type transcriptional regulator VirS [Pseudomonas citronellolis]KWR79665.1 AraC family transcriptional regulator [Pseudomonas sp. PI1]MDF3840497.1 AraC family transcriptional regulator [Pseudomonas citronellolis]WAB93772.1 AraC family transcriptional regulator [Pseudomonas citronellolis]WRT85008.1 AraC family transcriptional regulator [Pseudomonas citronellolis]